MEESHADAAEQPKGQAVDATAALIRSIWQRNLPTLEERVRRLEVAAEAAKRGALDDALRLEANDIAHKLAGSLGMFGFPEGTEAARRLERLMEGERPDAAEAGELTARLRAVLTVADKA